METRESYLGRWWHTLEDGRIQCDLCPRVCKLRDGQRGVLLRARDVRRADGAHHLRALAGFCIDPIEKKPLNHFYPGTQRAVVRDRRLQPRLPLLPELGHLQGARDRAARRHARRPTPSPRPPSARAARASRSRTTIRCIFAEYAIDTAQGVPRARHRDRRGDRRLHHARGAARVLPCTWTPPTSTSRRSPSGFYHKLCFAQLAPGARDAALAAPGDGRVVRGDDAADPRAERLRRRDRRAVRVVRARTSGPEVPLHFTAFHPDFKMIGSPPRRPRR